MNRSFDEQLVALREGYLTPQQFFAQTRVVWQRLAAYLLRRWRAPASYTQEDVVQELMFAAYEFVWRYDPQLAKGRTIGRYVEWNALDKAKKELHRARGCKLSGDPDKNPSRIAIPLSAFEVEPQGGDLWETIHSAQDAQIERLQAVQAAQRRFSSERERLAVQVLAENEGSVEDAALQLSSNTAFSGGLDAARFVHAVAARLIAAA